jgi:DNA-binding CsgD family transcriptional regulator
MDRLETADQVRLLEFAAGAGAIPVLDQSTAQDYIVRELSKLVVADCVLYRVLDANVGHMVTVATEPQVQASQDTQAGLWDALIARHEHPVVAHWNETGKHEAIRMSDLIGESALQRRQIYDQFWRPYAIKRTMGARVQLSSRYRVDLGFYRTGSDFSGRDVGVVESARFHIRQIVERADSAGLVTASISSLQVSRREADILALVARGRTNPEIALALFLAPGTVKKHLDHVYRKLGIRTRTEAALLVLAADRPTATGIPIPFLPDRVRAALGLTCREGEVLVHAASGKTNAEIAAILEFAPGTVKRTLENLYRKLGVGTRTEAAAMAITTIGSALPTT